MKLKKTLMSLAVGSALMGSTVAMAATILAGGTTYDNFGGFDWAANGLAVVDGFTLQGVEDQANTTLSYWAAATAVTDPFQGTIDATYGLNVYEYTIVATVNEIATCVASTGTVCTSASFVITSGSWSIYYDAIKDSNRLTGAGFTDGDLIMSGTFDPGFAGLFTLNTQNGGGGTGSQTFTGTVDYTNLAYINPAFDNTLAGSELKVAGSRTDGGQNPSFDGTDGSPVTCGGATVCLQADANQSFRVPEPGSLALLGLGLFGLGAARRKRSV